MQYFTAIQMNLTRPAIALAMLVTPLLTSFAAAEQAGKVKVYILSGQSNMVGIGQVSGGGARWGKEFTDTVVSVYEGTPDAKTDYDKLTPTKTIPLAEFGGLNATDGKPFPKEGVSVLRGQITMPVTGVYEFRSGYGASEQSIMVVNGTEVYRKESGAKAVQAAIPSATTSIRNVWRNSKAGK